MPRLWMFPTDFFSSSLLLFSSLLLSSSCIFTSIAPLFAFKPFQYIQMILPTIAQEIHTMIQ